MPRGFASFDPATRGGFILVPPSTPTRAGELGDFLRGRRAEVQPADVGLAADGRRRTPGLRREEVAQLAGVGLSWYTWLEQGREVRPSPSVLDAIGRVLRLDTAERAHLFQLARAEPPPGAGEYEREAPEELARLVRALDPHPAYLTNPRADVLAWNRAITAVLVDFGQMPAGRRNLLRWLLLDRVPLDPRWEPTARRTLARFRSEHGRHFGDPDFEALVEELRAGSPQFREWWPRHEVLSEQTGTKLMPRPGGDLTFHHLQSAPTTHPELRLTVYAPADETTRAALEGMLAG